MKTRAVAGLPEALSTGDVLERRQGLERLGLEWAKTNVDEAIASLDGVREDSDRQALIRGIFHFLSAQDRQTALEKVLKLPSSDRLAARKELLAAWAPRHAVESQRNSMLEARFGSGGLGMQLLLTSPAENELAMLWAKSLEPDEGKARMLTELAAGIVIRKSPAEAFKLGEELEGEDYVRFLGRVSDGWAQVDGKAALAWAEQITDPTLRENLQQSINSTWVISDLEGAKVHLQTMPAGSARESLLTAIASRLGSTDTANAFAWVQELANPADQSVARRVVESVAPVGIGVQLSMKDGLPAITRLTPGAPADLSRQVQPGDRIVGIDINSGNGFTSTNGWDLEKIAELIRGRPGTTVRLQLTRVNASGFDPPRVVELPRWQLLYSPGG